MKMTRRPWSIGCSAGVYGLPSAVLSEKSGAVVPRSSIVEGVSDMVRLQFDNKGIIVQGVLLASIVSAFEIYYITTIRSQGLIARKRARGKGITPYSLKNYRSSWGPAEKSLILMVVKGITIIWLV